MNSRKFWFRLSLCVFVVYAVQIAIEMARDGIQPVTAITGIAIGILLAVFSFRRANPKSPAKQ
jgi:hypothetical protein